MKINAIRLLANKDGLKDKQLYAELLKEYASEATARQVYYYQQGFTKQKLDGLTYDLKKMYQISEKEIVLFSLAPDPDDHNTGADTSKENTDALRNAKNLVKTAAEQELEKQADIDKLNLNSAPSVKTDPAFDVNALPEEVKEGLKFRDEYPFLNDPNTPDELKALAADKISAYKKYAADHAAAIGAAETGESEEALYLLAKEALKSWNLNQDIKAELDHYRDSEGKILGKHEKLSGLKLQQEVKEMTEAELVKQRGNAQKSVSRYKDNPDLYNKWKTRLEAIENRLITSFKYTFEK